jgi:hypothetical protein
MVPLESIDGAKVVRSPLSAPRKGRVEVSFVGVRDEALRVDERLRARKSTELPSPPGEKM